MSLLLSGNWCQLGPAASGLGVDYFSGCMEFELFVRRSRSEAVTCHHYMLPAPTLAPD